MADYLVWECSADIPNACTLGALRGFDDIYDLRSGKSFKNSFPKDVKFEMSPDFPKHKMLTDNLRNEEGLVVCSAALKEYLETRGISNMEYLRVSIQNHEGKIASDRYYIVNPLLPLDCLDDQSSEAEENLLLPGEIENVRTLVIFNEKVAPEREIFGIARFPKVTLLRRDLADLLSKQSFTGLRWVELSDYPEI